VRRLARWGVAIILAGVAINLVLAFLSIRGGAIRTAQNVSPAWLVAAALLGIAPTFLHSLRIQVWTGFLGAPTSLRQAVRAAFGTELGSAISPKAIGGAPLKLGLLMEAGVSAGTAASIVMLNNFEDVLFFTLVVPGFAFATATFQVPAIQSALARIIERVAAAAPWALGLVLIVVVVVAWRRWRRPEAARHQPVGTIRAALRRIRGDFFASYALVGKRGKLRFLLALSLTTAQWVCRGSVATAIAFGLGHPVDPVLFMLLQWVVWMTMVFVPTPGAAIGAEASFAAVMSGFVPRGILGLLGASWRFLSFYLVLLVGLAIVPALGTRLAAAEPVEDAAPPT
jgi:uncharacterized protein (TIRG00374 family)